MTHLMIPLRDRFSYLFDDLLQFLTRNQNPRIDQFQFRSKSFCGGRSNNISSMTMKGFLSLVLVYFYKGRKRDRSLTSQILHQRLILTDILESYLSLWVSTNEIVFSTHRREEVGDGC